ncbi:uncharacterized protein LOC123315155 [Coccinella septempunctata]|uniref:uncharacterized protein LOC123315155 n=1 Tax=Coccinella septempunctata TaxID=41139 RepID=UPI001D09187A|nr:uncharacterized protein LOC123315155 [Coccinella septempunctata]
MRFQRQCQVIQCSIQLGQVQKMSPRIPVSSLGRLCVKFVANQLVQSLSDDEGLNYEAVKQYLSDVTHEVLQELLRDILNSIHLDAATRFSILEVLLRDDVRKLDTGIFPHSYYEKILEVIISRGVGLRQLNLKGVWARDHPALLTKLVGSLNNLKVLIIPHMANDAILQRIADCRNLNVLDISGESYFTADGLGYLKNENLRILDVGYYGKKEICEGSNDDTELVSRVIRNLPKLREIRSYSFTGNSLFHLQNSSYITNITLLRDTETTQEIFHVISRLCPLLESIHLNSPKEGVIPHLKDLKRLIYLKICKGSVAEITQYLASHQSNLEVIKVASCQDKPLDLTFVAQGSPRVNTLEFYHMHLTISRPELFFMYLTNIEILYCNMTDNCLRQILANSPLLRRVMIGCAVNFTDGDLFRLCADIEFLFLEELWLSCAKSLTAISIELLMNHCPKLRFLGQMNGWDITSEEVEFFRTVIQVSNIDLTLLPTVF